MAFSTPPISFASFFKIPDSRQTPERPTGRPRDAASCQEIPSLSPHFRISKELFVCPEKEIKSPENAPGPYFVLDHCIDCDTCRATAPENFLRNAAKGYSFVVKQPENDAEQTQCQEALEACPVEAIQREA